MRSRPPPPSYIPEKTHPLAREREKKFMFEKEKENPCSLEAERAYVAAYEPTSERTHVSSFISSAAVPGIAALEPGVESERRRRRRGDRCCLVPADRAAFQRESRVFRQRLVSSLCPSPN